MPLVFLAVLYKLVRPAPLPPAVAWLAGAVTLAAHVVLFAQLEYPFLLVLALGAPVALGSSAAVVLILTDFKLQPRARGVRRQGSAPRGPVQSRRRTSPAHTGVSKASA